MTALALAVFSSGFVLTLVLLIAEENPPNFVFVIALYLMAVVIVQVALVAVLDRWMTKTGALIVAILAAMATAFSLYLVHLNQPLTISLLYTAGIGVGFGAVMLTTRDAAGRRLLAVGALGALPMLSLVGGDPGPGGASGLPAATVEKLKGYAGIRLKDRPNIYLISFDAMIPLPAAKKLLQIEELPYEDRLAGLGGIAEPSAFVTDTPSIQSLDAVMKLDDLKSFPSQGYFAGRLPSPVSTLLRANGYWIETGSSVPFYFGQVGGHIDDHLMIAKNLISDSSLCKFAGELAWGWGSFGFCRMAQFLEDKPIFDLAPVMENPNAAYFDSAWHQKVLARLRAPLADQPQFLIYYYYYPIGHAPNDFDSDDPKQKAAYRDRFAIQAGKLAEVVEELYTTIQQNDPNAVVMFFGDHGTKISRTVNWREETEFWVQDHHAVHLTRAGFGHDCTRASFPETYQGQGYMTIGRTVAATLRCLAREPKDFDQIVEFYDKFDFSQYLFD